MPWWLLEHADHAGVRDLVRDLNRVYRDEPALWEVDFSPDGFRWLEPNDAINNVFAFMRRSRDGAHQLVCVANLSPVPRERYRVGLPLAGDWDEALNTDSCTTAAEASGTWGRYEPNSATGTISPTRQK